MLDHDARSYALIARVFDGKPEGLTREDVLGNITLYWLTNTAISSARLYWESKLAFFAPKGVTIPAAVSAFPDELYQAPRSWAEKAYPKLVYYNKLRQGRALRRVGAAAAFRRRVARGVQESSMTRSSMSARGVLAPADESVSRVTRAATVDVR